MRQLLTSVINALLSAEADAACGAEYGRPSPERINSRNGYRSREMDTRVGTIDVAIRESGHRLVLSGAAAGAAQAAEAALVSLVASLLPAGSVNPPHGQVGRLAGHHHAAQVAGVPDGRRPRRASRRVPHPPLVDEAHSPSWPRTR